MTKKTATRIKQLDRYKDDVAVYHLSKALKKGVDYVVIADAPPVHGHKQIVIWASDEDGLISNQVPIKEVPAKSTKTALETLGYTVNG